MRKTDWEGIARTLYEALMQMRKSRGILEDDVDIMEEAFSAYEKNAFFNPNIMYWRVRYHRSDEAYYQAGCFECDGADMHLETLNDARKWAKEHKCKTKGEING